ncbi:hypothetical protein MBLNU459_g8019t1 [Dothideomycetes sp. NU459]
MSRIISRVLDPNPVFEPRSGILRGRSSRPQGGDQDLVHQYDQRSHGLGGIRERRRNHPGLIGMAINGGTEAYQSYQAKKYDKAYSSDLLDGAYEMPQQRNSTSQLDGTYAFSDRYDCQAQQHHAVAQQFVQRVLDWTHEPSRERRLVRDIGQS